MNCSIPNPVEPERIQNLNTRPVDAGRDYVLYWMQKAQRVEFNPALEYAARQARCQNKPLLVLFVLSPDYPEAQYRHYRFMLEGLADVGTQLAGRNIQFLLCFGEPVQTVCEMAANASQVVCERAYLRHLRQWRKAVASNISCKFTQIEGEVVVPVEQVSQKREYAARTIRPKIRKRLDYYLTPLKSVAGPFKQLAKFPADSLDPADMKNVEKVLSCSKTVPAVTSYYRGGSRAARQMFTEFLEHHFHHYSDNRSRPELGAVSRMSMYLHFGQVSPVWLALQIQASDAAAENRDAYLEELIIRRELCVNFVQYASDYDQYTCLPDWAQKSLAEHRDDERAYTYSPAQLEAATTHDSYWNAAMKEMKITGHMHNYMRMYWGKKVLEWTTSPEDAFEQILYLNNKYLIDGRDPASFANVGWIFGLHDRPWKEREVFGKVRYMNAAGLERKCRISEYVQQVAHLAH